MQETIVSYEKSLKNPNQISFEDRQEQIDQEKKREEEEIRQPASSARRLS